MRTTATHYMLGAPPVTGAGLGVSAEDLDTALAGSVMAVVFDDSGRDEITILLGGLADMDFARDNLETLLDDTLEPEDWRVGKPWRKCFWP